MRMHENNRLRAGLYTCWDAAKTRRGNCSQQARCALTGTRKASVAELRGAAAESAMTVNSEGQS